MTLKQQSEPLLTTGEVAQLFAVEPKTIRRWAEIGRIDVATRTLGGQLRFGKSYILNLLSQRTEREDPYRAWLFGRIASMRSPFTPDRLAVRVALTECLWRLDYPHDEPEGDAFDAWLETVSEAVNDRQQTEHEQYLDSIEAGG